MRANGLLLKQLNPVIGMMKQSYTRHSRHTVADLLQSCQELVIEKPEKGTELNNLYFQQ